MRTVFSEREVAEVRALLALPATARRADRRMAAARLRRLDGPFDAMAGPDAIDALIDSGRLRIDDRATVTDAIRPHPSGNVFRVAVGVTGSSVRSTWNAFDQRYHWFGKKPQSVTSGAHLFVLAVDRWKSAVVGLYEAVSAGADRLPDSPDPDRWPWALGVRPLAAILPPDAERIAGQKGPQSGLPERIHDRDAVDRLYAAVRASAPPPGPVTLEQRVQELEPRDVAEDVLDAVKLLGKDALRPAVIATALDLGDWNDEERSARAWYTGSGTTSHIQHILGKVLDYDQRLTRRHGSSPYALVDADRLGTSYRPAGRNGPATDDPRVHQLDMDALDRATRRHMEIQDAVAEALLAHGLAPRSPAAGEPQYDLAARGDDVTYLIEVKTGAPPTPQQARLGCGQVLEYAHRLGGAVRPVLCFEAPPPAPWPEISAALGISLLDASALDASVAALLR